MIFHETYPPRSPSNVLHARPLLVSRNATLLGSRSPRLRSVGLTVARRWTSAHDAMLRTAYSATPKRAELLALFPDRTWRAVRHRAIKLGLRLLRPKGAKLGYYDAKVQGVCTLCRLRPALEANVACASCRDSYRYRQRLRVRRTRRPTITGKLCGECRQPGHTRPTCPEVPVEYGVAWVK